MPRSLRSSSARVLLVVCLALLWPGASAAGDFVDAHRDFLRAAQAPGKPFEITTSLQPRAGVDGIDATADVVAVSARLGTPLPVGRDLLLRGGLGVGVRHYAFDGVARLIDRSRVTRRSRPPGSCGRRLRGPTPPR